VGTFETGVVGVSEQALTVVPGISTEHLVPGWRMTDEWLKHSRSVDTQPNIKVLLRRSGDPVAWYQEFGGGRMWYTGLGHLATTFANADFEEHVWGGIRWAARLP
jgi:Trehalose utilisation